jgi:hypothetical protein
VTDNDDPGTQTGDAMRIRAAGRQARIKVRQRVHVRTPTGRRRGISGSAAGCIRIRIRLRRKIKVDRGAHGDQSVVSSFWLMAHSRSVATTSWA